MHWGDSWIYYYDEANESFGKLCGRPECEHKGNGCNAYVSGIGNVQVYEDQLYFVVGASVADTNGTGWNESGDCKDN